jgi:hypothetical protein
MNVLRLPAGAPNGVLLVEDSVDARAVNAIDQFWLQIVRPP